MQLHHLLTGSYTNSTLFLLAFDTISRTLTLNSTITGFGLHQFVTSNEAKDRVYATTMSEPPRLFTWGVDEGFQFTHLSTNNITSSACYISDNGQYSFSAGGPTAQIHSLGGNGIIGDKTDELYLIPVDDISSVDKTRNAVLHSAHAFDVNVNNKGFVPHLGMNSIFMYDIADNGTAQLQSINLSPTEGDGPRNSYSREDGKLLYVVTEHTQWLDVYEVGETQLKHVQRASVIPTDVRGHYTFRSNTVQPSRDGKYLFASTRSWESPEANGYAPVFEVDDDGYLTKEDALTFYEPPVTLGSAGGLRRVMLELYSSQSASHSDNSSDPRMAVFMEIKKELQDWHSSLPPFLHIPRNDMPKLSPPPHITSPNLMYHNALILLHRPHVPGGDVPSSAAIRESWKICRGATTAIYDLLKMYIHTFGYHHITYMNSYCTYMAATTAVYQLETSEEGSQPSQSHQAAWTELKFLLDILQRTAAAMPGLDRSIEIIRARIKRILDRQVSSQLDSLFPAIKLKNPDHTRPTSNILQTTERDKASSNLATDCPVYEWGNNMGTVTDEDLWLPAFPAQDVSYGPEVMLDVQDALSPQTRSALMGSNLDPQLRLNLPVFGEHAMSHNPFPNALLGQLPDASAGDVDTTYPAI